MDKKLELGQATTSLHEVNTLMHVEGKSTVEGEDPKTENSPTGLAELPPSGPPGRWGDSRKTSTLPEDEDPPGLTDANRELEDYTGIEELFAEPD